MNRMLFIIVSLFAITMANAQQNTKTDLRSALLSQLKSTHNVKEWFVPVNTALEGLTPARARWTDGSGNHSVGQLAYHLWYWNYQALLRMKKLPQPKFDGNNDETFNAFDSTNWKPTVQKLDSVLTAIEELVEKADDNWIQAWSSEISHICTHNAYHTGQMIFVRKLQGSWDPEKGVK